MTDRWKNIMIGIFVTSAFAIGVALVLFLKPTYGDGKKILKVRFANISGLNKGTRVTYAGRPIGQVMKIEEIPNARSDSTDESGRVYYYQLLLRVDSHISVFTCDDISICTSGLMGERSIAILPKAPSVGPSPVPLVDQIVFANSIDAIESTFNQVGRIAIKAERTLDRVDDWFKQNAPTLAIAAANLSNAAQSVHTTLSTIEQQNLVPALKDSLNLASDNMRLLRSSLDDDRLLTRLASLVRDLDETAVIFNTDGARTLSNLNQISKDLATGSGTIGRFLNGDDFYLRLSSLMSKSETLMNDINHYGLLFQYNKQWQKNRTKKANIASALDSPKEFKAYFESEIDEIGASIGRISELIDRADQDKERDKIAQNAGFQRDVAVLLRQIKALNDSIRLFNQDIVAKLEEN
ncbi:MAG: MlaD protein [Parachlamydiales bacterium]|nr:MlaD protein [Parachlamydiales bacterium]